MKNAMLGTVACVAALSISGTAFAGKDLDAIKARGSLVCGVGTGTAGFMLADSQGKWTGLNVDVCRAIASAIFGDAEKVKYVPLTAQQRFTALQSGEVDLLYLSPEGLMQGWMLERLSRLPRIIRQRNEAARSVGTGQRDMRLPKAGTIEIAPSILSADFARLAKGILVLAKIFFGQAVNVRIRPVLGN